jgi:hypothetical protein
MTREEFQTKWSARRAEWEKLGAAVSGAKVCEEIVADFDAVMNSRDEAVLNTNEAAAMSGYRREHLLRLYRQGTLLGHRKGRNVFFRSGDLPKKPGSHRTRTSGVAEVVDDETGASARRLATRLGIKSAERSRVAD